jgi:acetyltransferase-like isoleucine patch superfamily enzyme
MSNENRAKIIPRGTPESAAMVASVKRAMAITPVLNRLTFNDAAQIRAVFSGLTGHKVDDSFSLIPPFYTTGGDNIRVGRNVFINQNCTMYDLGGIDIADDVMIGPNVNIITSSHPVEPSQRRDCVIAKPIVIGKNVWIAAGVTIIGGVTIGENAVVAAGSVVTHDVPPNTLVGGNPARVIRAIGEAKTTSRRLLQCARQPTHHVQDERLVLRRFRGIKAEVVAVGGLGGEHAGFAEYREAAFADAHDSPLQCARGVLLRRAGAELPGFLGHQHRIALGEHHQGLGDTRRQER